MTASLDWHWLAWSDLTVDRFHAYARLRSEVFVVEQDCVYLDLDGLDPSAFHLLGYDRDHLAACLRAFAPGALRPEAVIGRVVVAPSHRGTGLGRPLMEQGHVHVAATWGPCPIHVGAQAHLSRYYGSLGYVVSGPGYDEDGIPHLPMVRPA